MRQEFYGPLRLLTYASAGLHAKLGHCRTQRGSLIQRHPIWCMASSMNTPSLTDGATDCDSDTVFERWAKGQKTTPANNNLRSSIISTFSLPQDDAYVYHAIASVTLSQVQAAINHGGESGLHAWYLDDEGKPVHTCSSLLGTRPGLSS